MLACSIGATGFEPATSRPQTVCSSRLSYAPWPVSLDQRPRLPATGQPRAPSRFTTGHGRFHDRGGDLRVAGDYDRRPRAGAQSQARRRAGAGGAGSARGFRAPLTRSGAVVLPPVGADAPAGLLRRFDRALAAAVPPRQTPLGHGGTTADPAGRPLCAPRHAQAEDRPTDVSAFSATPPAHVMKVARDETVAGTQPVTERKPPVPSVKL